MKRNLIVAPLLVTSLGLVAHWAGQAPGVTEAHAAEEPVQDIGGKVRLLRLAVPAGDAAGEHVRKLAQLSAGFEVMDRRGIPANLIKDGGFNADAWAQTGAEAVIKSAEVGGQLRFQLFDLAKGDKPVLSKGYPAGDQRGAVNRFMNEVVNYYTGSPGVFGSRIAFVRTRRDPRVSKNVFSAEMDGGSVTSVTSNRSLNILPSIGPGGQVLYTSYAKRNPDLWIGGRGDAKQVSSQPGLNLDGVMSPNGSSIALTLSKDGNSELYVVGTDGSIKTRLTNSGAIDGSPTWNAGGSAIAYVSNSAGSPQIFTVPAGGGGSKRLTKSGSYNQEPDWSWGAGAAGDWVLYSGRDGGRYDIFKVNTKSGKTERLTQGSSRASSPSWSPDGRLVAFSLAGKGIVVTNEDGNNMTEIGIDGSTPDWGPRAN